MEKKPIDSYTVIHALYGFLAKKSGFTDTEILTIAILYEVLEPAIIDQMRQGRNPLQWNHEGQANIAVDIFVAWFGAQLAK
jgi:hypothetical protein